MHRARKLLAVALISGLPAWSGGVPGHAAGGKGAADGTSVQISDDLTGGSAGSVGLSGGTGAGAVSVSGSLGQTSTLGASLSPTAVEPGYFSKAVQTPANLALSDVFVTSFTVTFTDPGNPAGTVYLVQYSSNISLAVWPSTQVPATPVILRNLQQDTTYFVKVRAQYMEGDTSAFTAIVSTKTRTVPELLLAYSTPTSPADGSAVNVQPNFNWIGPSTPTLALLGTGAQYQLEVSAGDFATPVIDARVPATIQSAQLGTGNGVYISDTVLNDNTTYYWRVRTRTANDATGPYSDVFSFVTDFASPTASGFLSYNAAGAALAESAVNNLAAGVTAQITVHDPGSGLAVSTMTLPGGGVSVQVSTDAGQSWSDGIWAYLTSASGQDGFYALAAFSGKLYAAAGKTSGANSSAVLQYDGTLTNYSLPPGSSSNRFFLALAAYRGKLYAGGGSGSGLGANAEVWSYNGAVWALNSTLPMSNVAALAVYNGRLYAGTWGGSGSAIYVFDGGTWVSQATLPVGEIRSLAAFNGRLYAGTGFPGLVYVSTGTDWTISLPRSNSPRVLALAPYAGRLYAGTDGGELLSTDGNSWIYTNLGFGGGINALAVNAGKLFAGTGPGGAIAAYDGRMVTVSTRTPNPNILSLADYHGRLYAGSDVSAGLSYIYRLFRATSAVSGLEASLQPETLSARSLGLASSASPDTCGGTAPCAATNQVRFIVTDRAGNVTASGPYAILVDTTPPAAPGSPAAYQSGLANGLTVQWTAPGDDGISGAFPAGSAFLIQYATGNPVTLSFTTAAAQVYLPAEGTAPGALVSTGVVLPQFSQRAVYMKVWARDEAGNYSPPSVTASAFDSPFSFVTLDTSLGAGEGTSLAIAGSGRLDIAYHHGTSNQLKVASHGTAWEIATVDSPGGAYPSVAIGNDDVPFVVYQFGASSPFIVRIASRAGAGWTPSAVDSGAASFNWWRSVAVDASGFPHVCYYDSSIKGLRYARWDGTQWLKQLVDSGTNDIGQDNSIALDPIGRPQIAYRDATAGALKFARWNGSTWDVTVVDPSGGAGIDPVLALDGKGLANIVYGDNTTNSLKSAVFNGVSWTIKAIDAAVVPPHAGLALDGAGNAHVSYRGPASEVKYAFPSGAAWSTATVASNGSWTSLALDAAGQPNLSYKDTNNALSYAHWTGAGFAQPMGGNPRGKVQAPTGLAAVAVTSNTVTWQWTDSALNELGFRLYGGTSSAGPFSLLRDTNSVAAASSSNTFKVYIETGLAPGTTYFRYVAAVNAGGVVTSSGALIQTAEDLSVAFTTPTYPADQSFVNVQPNFNWIGVSTPVLAGLRPGAQYQLEVSSNDPNFSPANVVIRVSTPAVIQSTSAATGQGAYISTFTLTESATYHWRVRVQGASGSFGPYSQKASFVTDFTSPTASNFASLNSTGGVVPEILYNDLANGVTAQIHVQDVLSGLARSPGALYTAAVSTDAAATFAMVTSTLPGPGPYLNLSGGEGSSNSETLRVLNLALVLSTNSQTCGGTVPCGATNQVKFTVSDRAGNVRTAGPYAVVVDTAPPAAPVAAAYQAAQPNTIKVVWTVPADSGPQSALQAGSEFRLQYATGNPASLSWSTASAQVAIATGPVAPGLVVSTTVALPAALSRETAYITVWARDSVGNYSPPSAATAAFVSPFTLESVDSGDGAGVSGQVSLALDRSGNLHMAFLTEAPSPPASRTLKYKKRTGTAWGTTETVEPGGSIQRLDSNSFLALGPDDSPHVVYFDQTAGQFKHARREAGGSWVADTIEANPVPAPANAPGVSIAVDAAGNPHASYHLGSPPDSSGAGPLRYARWDGLRWVIETVTPAGWNTGYGNSLALDGAGEPRIAFHRLPDTAGVNKLYVARRGASGWTTPETADAVGFSGQNQSLTLDGAGREHIAHLRRDTWDLAYTSWTGTGWATSVLESAGDTGNKTAIALDGTGSVHIGFRQEGANDLKYLRYDGSSVSSQTLAAASIPDRDSLSLDAAGRVLIGYYDAASGGVRLATWPGAGVPAPMGGNARGRVQAPGAPVAPLATIFKTSATVSWTDSSSNELGFRLYRGTATTGPFALAADTVTLPANATVFVDTTLARGTTYFVYVAAVNAGGVVVSSATTLITKGGDFIPPTISDLQEGDSTWYRLNQGTYAVTFGDTGGSGLDRFQVKASTTERDQGPGRLPTPDGWMDAVTGISDAGRVNSYTTPWKLPDAAFAALMDEATNFISVRVLDVDGNVAVSSDVFYVKRDTSPPRIAPAQTTYGPYAADPGAAFSAVFSDPGGLDLLEYSASDTAGAPNGSRIAQIAIAGPGIADTSYATPFAVRFDQLKNNAANYVTLLARDRAGNSYSLTDAFVVGKDTSGPYVGISTPADGGFRSQLSALSGTVQDLFGVQAVEVTLQRLSDGAYWISASSSFASVLTSNTVAGADVWSLTVASVPFLDGTSYRLVACGVTPGGIRSATCAKATFAFDTAAPLVEVSVPAKDSVVTSVTGLAQIAGTAADPGTAPSGLARVEAAFRRLSDGSWWDFTSGTWTATQAATDAAGTGQWSLAATPLLKASLRSGASYYATARAWDKAVPPSSGAFFTAASTFTFVDVSSPSKVANLVAAEGADIGQVLLTWNAPGDDGTEGSLLPAVFLVQYASYSAVVPSTAAAVGVSSGAAGVLVSTRSLVAANEASSQAVSGLSPGATYYFYVWTRDDAGNLSEPSLRVRSIAKAARYLAGSVRQSDGEGLAGILVEAFDAGGARLFEGPTVAEGGDVGAFHIPNLPPGTYKVVVTYAVNDLSSSASKDGLGEVDSGVDFTLSIQYTLASIQGQLLSLKSGRTAGLRLAGARAQAAAETGAFVELYRRDRLVAAAPVHRDGRYAIRNLLPGTYQARVYDGAAYSELQTVRLREGQVAALGAAGGLLPEAAVFAFPNPAAESVTLRFESGAARLEASIAIYDVAGALVRELPGAAIADMGLGVRHAVWDTRNGDGKRVASGVYLFAVKVRDLATGARAQVTKKLAILR